MKVLHSLDVVRLEEILFETIEQRAGGGLLDPLLILVPTRQLVTYLKHRLLDRTRAVLGVHILTHRGLAVRALENALVVPPQVLGAAGLTALVEAILDASADEEVGLDRQHLRRFSGARAGLLSTFNDLREAGVTPQELAHVSASGKTKVPYAPLYARYVKALEALLGQGPSTAGGSTDPGWTDRAGLVQAALPHVAEYLRRKNIRTVLHHGAYELIGVHVELLCAADSVTETLFLLPAEVQGPAFGYASRCAATLHGEGASSPAPSRALQVGGPQGGDSQVGNRQLESRDSWVDRLRLLHDPDAALPPRDPAALPTLELWSTQGAEAELRVAALRAVALHERDGMALEEIAIVARSLEPYAPYLEAVLGAMGLPFTSCASSMLSRKPGVATLLSLLRVLAGNLERGAVIDLLRRRWLSFGEARTEQLDQHIDDWDRSSRRARIVSGIAEWRELPALDEADARRKGDDREGRTDSSLGLLLAIVEALDADRRLWMQAKTHDDHARFLRELLGRRRPLEGAGGGDIQGLIEGIAIAGRVRQAAAVSAVVTVAQVEELVQSMAGRSGVAIRGQDAGGVRVLDCMRSRGLTHRAVIWMGFQNGSFPGQPRADPYLDDEARSGMNALRGKALSVKTEGGDEERLLLAMTLAGARERVILCFQRADDEGRKYARSAALREVARLFTGQSDASALLEGVEGNPWRPEQIPAHPGERAACVAAAPRMGFVPPTEAITGATLLARDAVVGATEVLEALDRLDDNVVATLDYVRAVEKFGAGDAMFDGKTDMGTDPKRTYSPTAIERLARCPQSFFLHDVLGIQQIDDEVLPHRVEKRVLGSVAHATLAALYEKLAAEGWSTEQKPDRARELLEILWRRELEQSAGPAYKRLRGLFSILGDRWLVALREFVAADILSLQQEGTFRIQTERQVEARIRIDELELPLRGRLDRILHFQDKVWVDDYKTSKDIKRLIEPTKLLTGFSFQLPLYREMVAQVEGRKPQEVRARLLGLGPDVKDAQAELDLAPEVREGVLESVGVSVKLARRGFFPLHSDPSEFSYCGYCGYRRTCRRAHQPTLERLASHPLLADYFDVWEKKATTKVQLHTLAQVRAQRDDPGDDAADASHGEGEGA